MEINNKKINTKNQVHAILWQDAAYSFEKEKPIEIPKPNLITGFVLETNSEYVFVATNVSLNHVGDMEPIDGMIIPKNTIIEHRLIGDYHGKKTRWKNKGLLE